MNDKKQKLIESLNLILDKKIIDEILSNKFYTDKLFENINYFILTHKNLFLNEKNQELKKLNEINNKNLKLIYELAIIYDSKRWYFFKIFDSIKNLISHFPNNIILNIKNIISNCKYYINKDYKYNENLPILDYLFKKMNIKSDPKTFLNFLDMILEDHNKKFEFYSKLNSLKILLDNNQNQKSIIKLSDLNYKNVKNLKKTNNILFITSIFPSCLHGGGLRVLNFIKELSKNNNVYLFSLIDESSDKESLKIIESHCKYYKFNYTIDLKNDKIQINKIIDEYSINIVHYEWIYSTNFFEKRENIQQIFTYMEAVSLRLFLELKKINTLTYNWVEKLIELINCLSIELVDTQYFDSKIAVTRKDAEFFFNLYPNSNYYVLNHGFNLQEFMVEDKNPEKNSIIFVGNFKHTPNIEAINYFYFNIWFDLKIILPDIKFYIVGANSDLLDQEILQDKNIIISGQVNDVKPYIQNAMVCIAPLISGARLRGKVIEYAALKRTFVASPIAMEDIDFKNGEDFYLAENPHEYIKYIIELLNNTEKRNKFSASVYKKVIEKYDTKKLITHLEYFYTQNNL